MKPEGEGASVPTHRCGMIAVLGRPNVGKSTLVNALVGFRVSIVSPKPQTTRHRILGICTEPEAQLVFVDTPGVHAAGGRAMNRYLNRAAATAVSDVQVQVLVVAAGQWTADDDRVFELLTATPLPRVLVVNKVDRIKDKRQLLPYLAKVAEDRGFAGIYPISARRREGLDGLLKGLTTLLPEGPAIFDADAVTDRSERFLVSELIREQLMRQLGDELPYSSSVEIEQFEDEAQTKGGRALSRISAVIWVEREGQKAIVVGSGGTQMREIGKAARIAIEKLLDRKVFLQLWCKVRENWSDDEAQLRRLGYGD